MKKSDASMSTPVVANPFAKSAVSCGSAAAIPFECREGVRVLPAGTKSVRFGHNWLRRR